MTHKRVLPDKAIIGLLSNPKTPKGLKRYWFYKRPDLARKAGLKKEDVEMV